MKITIAAALFFSLAVACGGDDDGGGADAGPSIDGGAPDAGDAVTCANILGVWSSEAVTNTAGTISTSGSLAITASGDLHIGFMEPAVDATTGEDIMTTMRSGATWTSPEAVAADEFQNAGPQLVADGDVVHMVWAGRPVVDINDLFYSTNDGSGWAERVNLSEDFESGMGRHGFAPSLALGPNGELAVAYASGADGAGIGPAEIRVAFIEDGALTGAPVTIIPNPGAGCYDPVAIYDADGNVHVVADCGPLGGEDEYWATNASGSWATEVLPDNAGSDDYGGFFARAGDTLYVGWTSDGETKIASRTDGDFGAPVTASSVAGTDFAPAMAADDSGRLFLVFHRDNADNKSDLYLSISDDGTTFSDACNLTRTEDRNEWMVETVLIHPMTGLPHLTYVYIVPDASPFNAEVMHMSNVAAGPE